ncbi:hypothetical protein, partial [Dokdonella sp.]|uniref:hypothetical protein n=1 Tax=Dokdonella sp. TaxID=2291710 RepID=UPI003528F1D8
ANDGLTIKVDTQIVELVDAFDGHVSHFKASVIRWRHEKRRPKAAFGLFIAASEQATTGPG